MLCINTTILSHIPRSEENLGMRLGHFTNCIYWQSLNFDGLAPNNEIKNIGGILIWRRHPSSELRLCKYKDRDHNVSKQADHR